MMVRRLFLSRFAPLAVAPLALGGRPLAGQVARKRLKIIIEGKDLPPARSALAAANSGDPGDTQKVLKPEGGRKPGFGEGHTSPA